MSDEVLSQDEIEALIQGAGQPESDAAKGKKKGVEAETQAQAAPAGEVVDVRDSVPGVSAEVRPAAFSPVGLSRDPSSRNNVDLILDVQLNVAVELGRARMQVRDVLGLGPGSVVELDKHAGEPVEVVVNNKTVARGEVVVIDENFGVRITEIVSQSDRDAHAKAA